jgi:hypothetical protein
MNTSKHCGLFASFASLRLCVPKPNIEMNRSKQGRQSERIQSHVWFSSRGWFQTGGLLHASPMQTEGLFHTSPGQRPGVRCDLVRLQANGLPHRRMNRAFSAREKFSGDLPRALPWAGMTDAFGVLNDGLGVVNNALGLADERRKRRPVGTPSAPSTFASSPLCVFALNPSAYSVYSAVHSLLSLLSPVPFPF